MSFIDLKNSISLKNMFSGLLVILLFLNSLFHPDTGSLEKIPQSQNIYSRTGELPGFVISPYFNEQVCAFNYEPEIRIFINAPSAALFDTVKPTAIALFALPNGNTIEQTIGKKSAPEDDRHFDIQHIGAQTRFLRSQNSGDNLVIVYLETAQKSWPVWKIRHPDYAEIISRLISYLTDLFSRYNPYIVLTGHSGGGSFIFGYLDGVEKIPDNVKRISFLDSNYGYRNTYGAKILDWINSSGEHFLSVIAYNDSVALYNGAPVVSAAGGTWHKSNMMKNYLSQHLGFQREEDNGFIKHTALNGRIKFVLRKNPDRLILHTIQVELNGFIQSMLSGTTLEELGYDYYGHRAYSEFIQADGILPKILLIPPRSLGALTGSQFIQKIRDMSFDEREAEIYSQISGGNIPEFLRKLTKISGRSEDALGNIHNYTYEVMPDYLSVGSDQDHCRIPMSPVTAQRVANLFGAVLPTSRLVDEIYKNSLVKLEPVTFYPVGDNNSSVEKFVEHNRIIEDQLIAAGWIPGQLIAGIKKDVVLSNKITDSVNKDRVVIYGWHRLNGLPIQPLTDVHSNRYLDYSHGIRLINGEILLDDIPCSFESILRDPVLYKVLSNENGEMHRTSY